MHAVRGFIARPAADLTWIIALTLVSCYGQVKIFDPIFVVYICLFAAIGWACARMWGHPSVLSALLVGSSIAISLIGYGGQWRLFGLVLGDLWIITLIYVAAGELAALAAGLYAVLPGEQQKVTDAPYAKIFRGASEAAFWIVLVVTIVGVAAPFIPWQYTSLALITLVLLAIGNISREKPSREVFEKTYSYLGWALAVVIALGILAGLQLEGVVPNNDTLLKSVQDILHPPDTCAEKRDAQKSSTRTKLDANAKWRLDNTQFLQSGHPLAKQYLAQYESGQAGLNAGLRAADEEYERCAEAKTRRLPVVGWLNTVIYEWPWWATMGIVPLVLMFLFGLIFLKGDGPSDKAVDRACRGMIVTPA